MRKTATIYNVRLATNWGKVHPDAFKVVTQSSDPQVLFELARQAVMYTYGAAGVHNYDQLGEVEHLGMALVDPQLQT